MSLHSRNKVWGVASMLRMVSELRLAQGATLKWTRKRRTSFYQCFSGALIHPHLQFFFFPVCGNLEPPMTSVRKGLENRNNGKWERWRNVGTDGVGSVLSMLENWLTFVYSDFPLVWTWYPIQRPLSSFIVHKHMLPSGHEDLPSHDSEALFKKKEQAQVC